MICDRVAPDLMGAFKGRLHIRDGQWDYTGARRFRPRGVVRRYSVLQVQMARRVFRPIYTGHTPANWQTQFRWRDATFSEALQIDDRLNDTPLTIPAI